MAGGISRRRLLWGAASALGVARGVGGVVRAQSGSGADGFTPVDNGFGFRNWSPRDQYFESPPDPSRTEVRQRVRSGWSDRSRAVLDLRTDRFPERLVDAIATQLRQAIVQRAGANGHCYGMVLAAQQYYERPETIPVDRRSASDIEDPTVPVEEPVAPVYEDVVRLQAEQFLRFRVWLGRRAMLHPEWIDTGAILEDVESVVETFGTAALTLFDGSLYGHQVLAYALEDRGDAAVVRIYDPNRPAVSYRSGPLELVFDREEETATMRPYGRYTRLLFNQYDRIERASDRDLASPLDHLTVGRSTVRSSLFPLALVLVDTNDVEVTVVAPDGTELDRTRGTHMDRDRGSYARMRSLYGASPGTYRIDLFGHEDTDYELRAVVCDTDGTLVDSTRSGTIGVGEVHEYDLEIPEDGEGTMARTGDDVLGSAAVVGGAAVGGAAVGALGYRTLQQKRNLGGSEHRQPRGHEPDRR